MIAIGGDGTSAVERASRGRLCKNRICMVGLEGPWKYSWMHCMIRMTEIENLLGPS